MKKLRLKVLMIFAILFTLHLKAQNAYELFVDDEAGKAWVDSIYNSLSVDERIAQLFWISVEKSHNQVQVAELAERVRNYQPGGLVFLKSHPSDLVSVSNYFQSLSKVPLTVALDAEWGLGMRLDSVISYPYQMTLGAIQNDSLIYEMGKAIGRQLRRIGVTVNLAPVADVNNNPNNPVIGRRSFGENPANVSAKALAYMNGLQDANVLAVGKHFPGHGDTDTDSHKTLPQILHSRARLDSVELIPFKFLIDNGLKSIMSAHLEIPALEKRKGYPSGVSKAIVTDLLKEELGFKGMVVTDAVNMQGAKVFASPGAIDLAALQAGNDIVEFTEDLPQAILKVKQEIAKGHFPKADLEEKCKRVLAVKYYTGLQNYKESILNNLNADLNKGIDHQLNRDLYQAALTVVGNQNSELPLKNIATQKTVFVSFGDHQEWQEYLWRYQYLDVLDGMQMSYEEIHEKILEVKADRIILALEDARELRKNPALWTSFNQLTQTEHTSLIYTGNPYHLAKANNLTHLDAIVFTFQNNTITRDLATQFLYGAIGANGRMPVSITDEIKYGAGVDVFPINRLKYSLPESIGLDGLLLENKVDSIINEAIEQEAFPGCAILVALKGEVIFNKTYGYHTYEKDNPVNAYDLYDVASLTKIVGPLPLLMKAYEDSLINLDAPMSDYWVDWKKGLFQSCNKKDLTLREVLAHQAGLQPYLNYYPLTLKDGDYSRKWYRFEASSKYNQYISDNLYLSGDFKEEVFKAIRKSDLLPEKKYKYSGLAFMIFPSMLTQLYGEDYETLLNRRFYAPLGASFLGYLPKNRYPDYRLIPTEYDDEFRHELIHGVVHDVAAASIGGISGNAGLFSNANDLAKVFQMYLNGGTYGGEQYLQKATLDEFTKVQFRENDNRRGLAFDKPLFGNDTIPFKDSYPTPEVSPNSYGHSGFTGTFAWIDPDVEMIYIFLSNRVYPSREHKEIYELNVRPSVHRVFYEALKDSEN